MADLGGGDGVSGAIGAGASETGRKALAQLPEEMQELGSALIGATAAEIIGGNGETGTSAALSGMANNDKQHREELYEKLKQASDEGKTADAIKYGALMLWDYGVEMSDAIAVMEATLIGGSIDQYLASHGYQSGAGTGGAFVILGSKKVPEKVIEAIEESVSKVTGKADNIWSMSRGGGVINGRKYSEHALERMAPDTVQVRTELEKRAIEKGLKPGTKEFKNYVDPRGIPPMVVEDTIKNIKPVVGNRPNTLKYDGQNVTVITNVNGDVITVIPK